MWMKNYVGLEYLEQKGKVHVRRMSPTPRSTHTSNYFTQKELLLTQHSSQET